MTTNSPSWYIPGEGKQPTGPFTAEQLIQSWRAGRIGEKTMCWREGMPQWLPLAQVDPFAQLVPPAVTKSQPSRIKTASRVPIALRLLPFFASLVLIIAVGMAYLLTREPQGKVGLDTPLREMSSRSPHAPPGASKQKRTIGSTNRGKNGNRAESTNPLGQDDRESPTQGKEGAGGEWGTWLYQTGGFGLQLVSMKREHSEGAGRGIRNTTNDDSLLLEFVVTKVKDSDSRPEPVSVAAIDDHGNEYNGVGNMAAPANGDLPIDISSPPLTVRGMSYHTGGPGSEVIPFLPKGFAYVDKVEILVPKQAVLKKLKVGSSAPISLDSVVSAKPQLLEDFGPIAWKKGSSLQVGKWLSFTCKGISPDSTGVGWEVPVEVTNKEYNPLEAVVFVGVQYRDGTLFWGGAKGNAQGSSETDLPVSLVLPVWTKHGPPQPVALLLLFENIAGNVKDFTIIPLSAEDMPPRVGQGADERDYQIFENAYSAHGGREVMGNPMSHVRWLAGGDKPRDEKDMVVQHFPNVSQFGTSAILWDKQHGAAEAYVIHGPVWEQYLEQMQNGRGSLGSPVRLYESPETGYEQFDFEGGYIASTDGKTWQAYPYEDGKIAFVSDRDGNKEIYVTDPAGKTQINLTMNPANDWSPAWSPDGKKIAFVSNRVGQPAVYVMDADGSNVQQLASAGEDPCWFPDGSKIAFVRRLQFKERSSFGGSDRTYGLYGLFTMQADGSAQKQLPIDPRKVRKHRLGDWQGNIRRPNVSIDGKTIAFAAGDWDTGHEYEIALFKLGTGTLIGPDQLSGRRGGMGCDNPSASRDGTKLAFRADIGHSEEVPARGGSLFGGQLHWMDLSGRVSKVCEDVWCWGGLDWSAEGQAIVFSGGRREGETDVTNVCIVRLDRRVARYITHASGNNYDPSWCATGEPQPSDHGKGDTR